MDSRTKLRLSTTVLLLIFAYMLVSVNSTMVSRISKVVDIAPREITYQLHESEVFDFTNENLYVEPVIGIDGDIIPYDVIILAHVINGEAGSNWCKDEMLYGVGSVVLNRVFDKRFPNTVEEVVFQKGQYSCTRAGGGYYKEPCERAWKIAWELYENGTTWPKNVVFQAQFEQGDGVYKKIQNMYFCYK